MSSGEQLVSTRIGSSLRGSLLGTALGDALGLPVEGLSAKQIARRYGEINNFHFLLNMGFVSDDTEQTALLARAIAMNPEDANACAEDFKKALLGWFLRLPAGIGLATIRACLNICFRAKQTGVKSAGNGSSMRAAIIGVYFHESPVKRLEYGKAICKITHTDPRALAAALFVAELAAACTRNPKHTDCQTCFDEAMSTVDNAALKEKLQLAAKLAVENADIATAVKAIKNTGFVLHSIPLAAFCFLRFGNGETMEALSKIISAGGDTDSNAAILGAWLGAKKGEGGLGTEIIDEITGPFGPTFLRRLGKYMARQKRGSLENEEESVNDGDDGEVPRYFWPSALMGNLSFIVLVLIHVLIRFVLNIKEMIVK